MVIILYKLSGLIHEETVKRRVIHLTPTITELTPNSALVYHNNDSLTLNCPDSQKLIPSWLNGLERIGSHNAS
jgi:hypothetical protein